jgi:alpha-mannosidase
MPAAQSFVKASPANLVVTALKKAEKSNSLVVRVFNTTPDEVEAAVTLTRKFKSATLSNLNEEPVGTKLTARGNTVSFAMPGFRVQTVLFNL